jgi:2',3'-cyclic-nucleotide 2'-phosphodiesterase (5'-nucleotidase family)
MARIAILHTNDLHGALSAAKVPCLASARAECDLFFDTGDSIKAGNLAIPLSPDPVWPIFAAQNITASSPGNRETHVLPSAVHAKIAGAQHPILCSNWREKAGNIVFEDELIVECQGLRVGLFGVMVPMVTARMKTQGLSAYLWDQPIETAIRKVGELRPRVNLLIALTHIGLPQDRRLAEACPSLDLILGGHSHNVLEQPEVVAGVPICQGGSHARFLGRYVWESDSGLVQAELLPWTEAY